MIYAPPIHMIEMSRPIKIISYNLHGLNQGEPLLNELCSNLLPDVVFLQEHWLSSVNLNKLHSFSVNYFCLASSAMEAAIQSGILRGRPFGGVAILFRKILEPRVICTAATDRFIIARIANIIFINVYAPTVNKKTDQYCEVQRVLSEINDVLQSSTSSDDVIIFGGDFNVDLRFSKSNVAGLFDTFFY